MYIIIWLWFYLYAFILFGDNNQDFNMINSMKPGDTSIYTSVNWLILGSDNGLLRQWYQAISWIIADLLAIVPSQTNFSEI